MLFIVPNPIKVIKWSGSVDLLIAFFFAEKGLYKEEVYLFRGSGRGGPLVFY